MKDAPPPRFNVAVTHHRITRGILEAADRRLPEGFEPTVRGAFVLADTLELTLVGGPAGEAPARVHRLRGAMMTHTGDLLVGGWVMRATAGPTGLDVLRTLLGPAAESFTEPARVTPRPPAGTVRAFDPSDSIYPFAAEAAAAAAPALPWLLPLRGGRVRTLRFEAPARGFRPADRPAGPDRHWARLVAEAGFGEAIAEAQTRVDGLTLRWHTGRPHPLLDSPAPAVEPVRVAAVA